MKLLRPFEQHDVERLQIVNVAVPLKLLADFGAHVGGVQVDGIKLADFWRRSVPISIECTSSSVCDGPGVCASRKGQPFARFEAGLKADSLDERVVRAKRAGIVVDLRAVLALEQADSTG